MSRLFLVLVTIALTISQSVLNGEPTNDHLPRWSPDGSRIAFLRTTSESENGPSELITFNMLSPETKKLPTATTASYPIWSPDGNRMAYVENRAQIHSIHLMNADGSQDRRIVERSGTIEELAWSPDGSRIASFSSGELFVVTLDDGEVDVLADEDVTGVQPVWSPNGNQILYVKQINSPGMMAIVVINADGGDAKTIIERPSIASVIFAPSGNQVAFVYREGDRHELAIVDVIGNGFTRLAPGISVEAQISWSPDGTKIAYTHDENVYFSTPDGTVLNFYNWADRQFLPSWSPDGNLLAFISDSVGSKRVYVFSSAGNASYNSFEIDSAMTVDHLAWSPDSTRIVAHSYEILTTTTTDLYIMKADGGEVTKLSGELAEEEFAWSPNGQKIAFASGDLYVVDGDGTDLLKLTTNLAIGSYQWSPDSQELAFVSDALYVVNSDGTGLLNLSSDMTINYYAWSPSGNQIAFTNNDLYVVDSDGSNFQKLTSLGTAPFLGNPVWSPDGTKIAFATGSIYVVDAGGGNPRKLTEGSEHAKPAWSPDGRKIAYLNHSTLFVVDANGANNKQLSFDGGDWPGMGPIWSPDSRRIIFSNTRLFSPPSSDATVSAPENGLPLAAFPYTLFLINADGSNQTRLDSYSTSSELVVPPSWSPDGSVIVMNLYTTIYLFDADGSDKRLITSTGTYPSFAPDGRGFVYASANSGNSDLHLVTINR